MDADKPYRRRSKEQIIHWRRRWQGEEEKSGGVFLLRSIIPDEALRALPKRVSVSFLHARIERSADIGGSSFLSSPARDWLKLNDYRYRSLTLILIISQNLFYSRKLQQSIITLLPKIIQLFLFWMSLEFCWNKNMHMVGLLSYVFA